MRIVVLALMIALLPLRGWMGEAMATEMATVALQHKAGTAEPEHRGHRQKQATDSREHAINHVAESADSAWAAGRFDAQTPSSTSIEATAPPATGTHTSKAATHHDCMGHADAEADTANRVDQGTASLIDGDSEAVFQAHGFDPDCGSCVACQVCHTVALSAVVSATRLAFASMHQPRAAADAFASADAVLSQKPPIS